MIVPSLVPSQNIPENSNRANIQPKITSAQVNVLLNLFYIIPKLNCFSHLEYNSAKQVMLRSNVHECII